MQFAYRKKEELKLFNSPFVSDINYTRRTGEYFHTAEEKFEMTLTLLQQLAIKEVDIVIGHSAGEFPIGFPDRLFGTLFSNRKRAFHDSVVSCGMLIASQPCELGSTLQRDLLFCLPVHATDHLRLEVFRSTISPRSLKCSISLHTVFDELFEERCRREIEAFLHNSVFQQCSFFESGNTSCSPDALTSGSYPALLMAASQHRIRSKSLVLLCSTTHKRIP